MTSDSAHHGSQLGDAAAHLGDAYLGGAYLDNAATTPMCPEAVEAMQPFYVAAYANPSGAHRMARDAMRAMNDARDLLAELWGAEPGEIVFCSGATEADNLAVFGVAGAVGGTGTVEVAGAANGASAAGVAGETNAAVSASASGPSISNRIVCSAIEHPAVLAPVERLGGMTVGVDSLGVIDLDELAEVVDENTVLVSVMLVNNESGVIQPLAAVAEVLAERAPQAVLHTDAVQAMSWLDVAELTRPAQLVSFSAHKFGGPKGVGALIVRDGVKLNPLILGGGQERDRRGGTHNVAGIAGMAAAAEVAAAKRQETVARVEKLRNRLADHLKAAVPDVVETGVAENCFADAVMAEAMSESLAMGASRTAMSAQSATEGSRAAASRAEPSRAAASVASTRANAAGISDASTTEISDARTDRSRKIAGSCHLCFGGVESEELLFLLEREGVYASAASSCASGAFEPSHVLAAMGYGRDLAKGSLRLSLGTTTTEADIDRACAVIPNAAAQLRRAAA